MIETAPVVTIQVERHGDQDELLLLPIVEDVGVVGLEMMRDKRGKGAAKSGDKIEFVILNQLTNNPGITIDGDNSGEW